MSRFPTTHWSLIDMANCETTTGSREAMGRLLETYRQPMYLHLRSQGAPHEKAEDLIQDFTIEILNRKLLDIADPGKGKFRTLLLTALDRFRVGKHRYDTAAKRSPGDLMSLDAEQATEARFDAAPPSDVFERAWAIDVLAQALASMKEQCDDSGDQARWLVFEKRVLGPLLDDAPKPEYDDLAAEFGLKDGKAAMNLLVTAKRQYTRVLRDLVTEYVTRSADATQQQERVAQELAKSNTKPEVASRVAKHMVQQSIRQSVEEELRQLQHILTRSHAIADNLSVEMPATEGNSLKMEFYGRLTGKKAAETSAGLLDMESSDEEEVPMDAYFSAVLNSDIGEYPGLTVAEEGPFIDVLLGDPSIETLKAIKEWSNLLRAGKDGTLPPEIASAIYFLVLGLAKSIHGQKITGMSDDAMQAGMKWLQERPWINPRIEDVVQTALD